MQHPTLISCLQEMDVQLVKSRKIIYTVSMFTESNLVYQLMHQTSKQTSSVKVWEISSLGDLSTKPMWRSQGCSLPEEMSPAGNFIQCNSISWCVLFWTKFILYSIAIHNGLLAGQGSCWKIGWAGGGALVTGSLQGSSVALFSAASSETVTVNYSLKVTKHPWPLPG